MSAFTRLASLWLATVLVGCGNSSNPHEIGNPAARALCLNCNSPAKLLSLPQLENGLFSSNGRLFVSGQSNLYEVRRDGQNYAAESLLPDGSGCSGLAEDRLQLYALCSTGPDDESGLYVLDLSAENATLQPIFALTGMSLPNGMVAAGGALYVTDGPVAAEPKIVRLSVDAVDPHLILGQTTWLLTLPDYPNGLAYDGSALYTTFYQPGGGGQVSRLPILPDGSAGVRTDLTPRGIMDDLAVVGDTLIVTDWQNGALFQIDPSGNILQQTAANSFAQPSSVTIAGPPLFDQETILVTERYTGDGLWAIIP